MICRIWHGWTTLDNADAYEELLTDEILPWIAGKEIDGFEGAHMMRRDGDEEVEFVTILWFRSLEAVRAFAGEDHEAAVVPAAARQLLSRFDERSRHYEVKLAPQ